MDHIAGRCVAMVFPKPLQPTLAERGLTGTGGNKVESEPPSGRRGLPGSRHTALRGKDYVDPSSRDGAPSFSLKKAMVRLQASSAAALS